MYYISTDFYLWARFWFGARAVYRRSVVSVAIWLVWVLCGCSLDQGAIAEMDVGDPALDSRVGDGSGEDAIAPDARVDGARDATPPDTRPPVDAGPRCPTMADRDTVAYFEFGDLAGGLLVDATGRQTGMVVGGDARIVPGPPGCGDAIGFTPSPFVYGVIEDSTDFYHLVGSFDFFMRYDGVLPRPNPSDRDSTLGVFSRDANGTSDPGHITIRMAPTGELILSIQRPGGRGAVRCTDSAITPGTWHHVGVNLGEPSTEIYLDGDRGGRTDRIDAHSGGSPVSWDCGDEAPASIEGNDNPIVIGASGSSTNEGGASGTFQSFREGAMDQLRISRVRRPF